MKTKNMESRNFKKEADEKRELHIATEIKKRIEGLNILLQAANDLKLKVIIDMEYGFDDVPLMDGPVTVEISKTIIL
jgi:hypothetical protein